MYNCIVVICLCICERLYCILCISNYYYVSTPHYAYDCIFYSTAAGRKFLHYCDVVHKFSDDVIMQRREELLQVYNISVISGQFKSVLLYRKQNQLESTKTF